MGRNFDRNQSILQFEKNYKGCILGLIPLQFPSFKKFMPLLKQKYEKPSKDSLKTESKEFDVGQVFEVGNSDSGFTATENISMCTSQEGRRIKGKVPGRPTLKRTYAIHHLEPESNYLDVDQTHPVVIQEIYKGSGDTNNTPDQPRTCANADLFEEAEVDGYHHFSAHREPSIEKYEDFFEVFQIDKKLLMKSTQNSDVDGSNQCQVELKCPEGVNLRRSGSFPMAKKHFSRYGGLMPSNLESTLTEIWPSFSSSSSSSASSSSIPSLENYFSRRHSCKLPINMFGQLAAEKDPKYRTDDMERDYASDVRRYKLSRIRRATSLNESLERYTQLYDTSFKKDTKLNSSKSLRVSNGNEVGFSPYDFVYLRKVQSMREALQVEWISDSIEFSEVPNKSTTLRIDSELADLEVNIHESFAGFERQLSCSYSSNLKLPDELQIKSESDPYLDTPPQLGVEDIKTPPSNQDLFVQDSVLGTESRVPFNYEQNVLNLLEALKKGNSTSTALYTDLDEELLYDLVNEALVDIYSIIDAYWPTPLYAISSSHIHPIWNRAHYVTRSVLTQVQKLQSLSQKTSNSTDNVVSYDLAQDGGWMNLQADAESLGLTIDEIIFDELLDELMYE